MSVCDGKPTLKFDLGLLISAEKTQNANQPTVLRFGPKTELHNLSFTEPVALAATQ
jgi:hypothetical protein